MLKTFSTALALGLSLPFSTLDIGKSLPKPASVLPEAGIFSPDATSGSFPAATPQLWAQAAKPRKIKVWANAFIPNRRVSVLGLPGKIDVPKLPDIPMPGLCFSGDNRGFSNDVNASARIHLEVEFDVATGEATVRPKIGTTSLVQCLIGIKFYSRTASAEGLKTSLKRNGRNFELTLQGSAKNPLVPLGPPIDFDFKFAINPSTRQVVMTGNHDGYPAYEAYMTVDGSASLPIYQYQKKPIANPLDLYKPMEVAVSRTTKKF